MENKQPLFTKGQQLKVTDNTGKPFNQIQTIEILGILPKSETQSGYYPEYKVWIYNPDEDEIIEHGKKAHKSTWALDRAIQENRIFVEEL